MRILFLCHRLPYPPKRGGKIRPFNMIRRLARRHEVTVCTVARTEAELREGLALREHCAELHVATIGPLRGWGRFVAHGLTAYPSTFGYFWAPELQRTVNRLLSERGWGAILVHCSSMGPYVAHHDGCRKVLDYGDADSEKWLEYARRAAAPLSWGFALEAAKVRRYERWLGQRFDACSVISPRERDVLSAYVRRPIAVIPNGVDVEYFSPRTRAPRPRRLIFTGNMSYRPNIDAVRHLCGAILPRVRRDVPDVELAIVGMDPAPAVQRLAALPGVIVTGRVDDVRPYFEEAAVAVAPLRVARGLQNKVLEAMAMQVPVVASPAAHQGVSAVAGRDLLVGADSIGFAQAVVGLLGDPAAGERMARAGRAAVQANHCWDRLLDRMEMLVTGHDDVDATEPRATPAAGGETELMDRERLLIVEDNEDIQVQLKYALGGDYQIALAANRKDALGAVRAQPPAVVTLDLGLPPHPDTAEEGLAALEEILRAAPLTKVVVLTGNHDRANALKAVELGAFDFHLKPVNLDDLRVVLRRATYLRALERDTHEQNRREEETIRFKDILGSTPKMREIFNVITRVARTDATVLIEGESGTGKELIARAIHANSPRKAAPFVAINCGAIPETLLESELFGHEKGAFTGAHVQRKGKLELASGGTLFLDEIGEMSLALQVKLLRFLQEREIERVGGRETIAIDVRVLAATNSNLEAGIQKGAFREDLYYRLSVVTIRVPPLRERGEDVVLLANAFLRRNAVAVGRRVRFSSDALRAIVEYGWPGNIRELENKVHRAVIMVTGRTIEPPDLDLLPPDVAAGLPTLREARDQNERKLVIDALARNRGNISRAAVALGISRPTFHEILAKLGINAKEFR